MAVLLTFLFALIGLIKASVSRKFPLFRWVGWAFPPVADFIQEFSNTDFYMSGSVVKILLLLLIYGTVLTFLQIYFLSKNKF